MTTKKKTPAKEPPSPDKYLAVWTQDLNTSSCSGCASYFGTLDQVLSDIRNDGEDMSLYLFFNVKDGKKIKATYTLE